MTTTAGQRADPGELVGKYKSAFSFRSAARNETSRSTRTSVGKPGDDLRFVLSAENAVLTVKTQMRRTCNDFMGSRCLNIWDEFETGKLKGFAFLPSTLRFHAKFVSQVVHFCSDSLFLPVNNSAQHTVGSPRLPGFSFFSHIINSGVSVNKSVDMISLSD